VVAHDLGPSDTAQMIRSKILGFCTNLGGQTSHTAIMAKALQIPAVVGLEDITKFVCDGDLLIVDGNEGTVILSPSTAELDQYRRLADEWRSQRLRLSELKDLPAETLDGERIVLMANVELPEEVTHVHEQGAEGIGLFRTEFTYLERDHLPTEDELLGVYTRMLKGTGDLPVVFRTLDLGGDKFISALPIEELNPFMGLRALRLCLENPDMFATQLRAILRAAAGRPLHLLFPMVAGLEDFRKAKAFFGNVHRNLVDRGIPVPTEVLLGVMIEIPSAAVTADFLAEEVDFFSIGTNDLIQYTLAVDRVNKRVAYLYEPLHPAVLRLIDMVVKSAARHNVPVSVCGEMAANPEMAAVLVGLGVRELSMGPISIPSVKRILRSVKAEDLRKMAAELLDLRSVSEVTLCVQGRLTGLLTSNNHPADTKQEVIPVTEDPGH
jgi:phosphotransferase system enzyme I (PtsI)